MFENIVQAIICSEFQNQFGRDSKLAEGFQSCKDKAMLVKFSLTNNYDIEEGYRNLSILIFGGGSNYISVFAKAYWNVIRNEWSEGDTTLVVGKSYIKGETPWITYGCHDSCWRDSVNTIIWEFRERINSIDWVFGGWYKTVPVPEKEQVALREITRERYSVNSPYTWKPLHELEFHFEEKEKDSSFFS